MQLFQTRSGVARRRGDRLEILAGVGDLHDLVVHGTLPLAARAGVADAAPVADVPLQAPVRPGRLFLVGLNYRSHLAEIGLQTPERPVYAVAEPGAALCDPDAIVTLPADNPDEVDHECEVAIVIGARAHRIDAASAWQVIAGVTAANDVSARGLQRAGLAAGDQAAGKLLPGFKPLGPGLITSDEVSRRPIPIRLTVNGEVRQESDTSDMVFPIPHLIAVISADHELLPGDVVLTGSPGGVGLFSGRYLQPDDVVEVTAGSLPPLRTTFRKG